MFKRLLFGASVSSAIFNRVARTVILSNEVHHKNIRVYVDDIKLETSDFDSHFNIIKMILARLDKSGMGLSIKKTHLLQPFVKFLGFWLQKGLISKSRRYDLFFDEFEKMHLFDGKLVFKDKRSVQHLLGFLSWYNWYNHFIFDYTTLVKPFQDLLSRPMEPYVVENLSTYQQLKELLLLSPFRSPTRTFHFLYT